MCTDDMDDVKAGHLGCETESEISKQYWGSESMARDDGWLSVGSVAEASAENLLYLCIYTAEASHLHVEHLYTSIK